MYILWWIIVGLIAGWLTGKLMKGSGYGALMDIVVGIVGAVIGGFVMSFFGESGVNGFNLYSFIVALVGACILIAIVRAVRR